jgi:hypothetical protein
VAEQFIGQNDLLTKTMAGLRRDNLVLKRVGFPRPYARSGIGPEAVPVHA